MGESKTGRMTLQKDGIIKEVSLPRTIHLVPLDEVDGFEVRPGFYEINGATAIPGGVNFTVHSHGATSIELLLFHREQNEPFAVLPFPEHYRIGNVYSMIVFKLNIEEFEYAYRVDGPYEPEKGLIFDKNRYLLDPLIRMPRLLRVRACGGLPPLWISIIRLAWLKMILTGRTCRRRFCLWRI